MAIPSSRWIRPSRLTRTSSRVAAISTPAVKQHLTLGQRQLTEQPGNADDQPDLAKAAADGVTDDEIRGVLTRELPERSIQRHHQLRQIATNRKNQDPNKKIRHPMVPGNGDGILQDNLGAPRDGRQAK